jgi:hypothetical protein
MKPGTSERGPGGIVRRQGRIADVSKASRFILSSNDPHSGALRPIVLVLLVDLSVVAGGRILLVLPGKSHRLAVDRKGYKAGRFTYLLQASGGLGKCQR